MRARALGLSVHLTDPFRDVDVAADLRQFADQLQRINQGRHRERPNGSEWTSAGRE
jgi:hypothetical protein